jgi:thymidylate synthase (FAD)
MEVMCTAASQCYQRKVGPKTLLSHVVGSGHLSVLEHCSASIVTDFSLAVLGQITRHRHLSFTVMSTRGADIPQNFIVPKEIEKSEMASDYIDQAIRCFRLYNQMIESGISHEHAAYILPKSMVTKLVITGNFRAWYEYLPKRECKRALQEHRDFANDAHKALAIAAPEIFDRNFMGCKDCKEIVKCKFH